MTKKQFLEIARTKVPENLHKTATVVVHKDRPAVALASARKSAAPGTFDDAMAVELGKPLPPKAGKDSADVVFHEKGRVGVRSTVVMIRNGKVKTVLKRG